MTSIQQCATNKMKLVFVLECVCVYDRSTITDLQQFRMDFRTKQIQLTFNVNNLYLCVCDCERKTGRKETLEFGN